MRAIVQPPPSSHCDQCGGDLRLKLIEAADHGLDVEYQIFVCANCGLELSLTVNHDEKMPHDPYRTFQPTWAMRFWAFASAAVFGCAGNCSTVAS